MYGGRMEGKGREDVASLTNQLESQDTVWHGPLNVIMLCGSEVITSHKVCLKETIVWITQTDYSSKTCSVPSHTNYWEVNNWAAVAGSPL